MYEHIHICLVHKHTTHSISHIYISVHQPRACNTNTLHIYTAVTHRHIHITYNIYLLIYKSHTTPIYHLHIHTIHMYVSTFPFIYRIPQTQHTFTELCRYTENSDTTNKMNILQKHSRLEHSSHANTQHPTHATTIQAHTTHVHVSPPTKLVIQIPNIHMHTALVIHTTRNTHIYPHTCEKKQMHAPIHSHIHTM